MKRRITEDDLRRTEAAIEDSYGAIRRSVEDLPRIVYQNLNQTVHDHPLATVSAIAGITAGGLLLASSRRDQRERGNTQKRNGDIHAIQDLLSLLLPVVSPILINTLLRYGEEISSGQRR